MNKLSIEKRAQVLHALCEGMSIRGASRLVGVARNTITSLLESTGSACLDYQDEHLVNLDSQTIECDEIWSFCYSKKKNVPKKHLVKFGYGDVWTWVAMDSDTKLVPCWLVGERTAPYAKDLMDNLACRLNNRVQLTTDGHKAYLKAVEGAFGNDIDYAMLVKMYGSDGGTTFSERKYSPGKCTSLSKVRISGEPEFGRVSTSYVERQNLTMRMHMRRFTRLTNAFSKKIENHIHALSLFYMYYNFGKVHMSLDKQTPAMAAGVSDHVWSFEEIARLSDSN